MKSMCKVLGRTIMINRVSSIRAIKSAFLRVEVLSISLILASVLWFSSCDNAEKSPSNSETGEVKIEKVKVVELKKKEVSRTIESTSTLIAFEELHLSPSSPGRIENIYVEVGSRVNKGMLLLEMDKTQLQQAELQLQLLQTEFNRLDTLRKLGSIAQQQYDQTKSQFEIAISNVEFLRRNIQLRAPFSGIVSGKYFEPGEMYSGSPIPQIGKSAVVSLVQINQLRSLVSVSEKYFPFIERGMEINLTSDIYPNKSFPGKIYRIHPTIDPASRSFPIEIVVNNEEEILRPGMFARVSISIQNVETILIPSLAVLKLQGSNERYLFKIENNKAKRVVVSMGERFDDLVEVFSPELEEGDKIVLFGQARLIDGVPTEIIQ